jgi:hypothetical protein
MQSDFEGNRKMYSKMVRKGSKRGAVNANGLRNLEGVIVWDEDVVVCCLPMAELVYLTLFTVLSGAPNTQSACQTPKYCFLVGHVCCIRNISQYRLSPAEYRQPKLPSSYQLHHLVLELFSQVVKNPPCSGFKPGTSWTRVRRSNHYTIELCNH